MQRMNDGFPCYLKNLLDDPTLSDVTIIVDNDQKTPENDKETVSIQAHRLVLTVMSGYFQTMFYSNSADSNRSEIRLTEVPYSVFRNCLRFMYCGLDSTLSNMSLDEVIKFYSAARKLQIDTKIKSCFLAWITNNTEKWVNQPWTVFSKAVEWDLPEVVLRCKDYVTDVANESLFYDAFRTVPLAIVQMVLSCEKINCTEQELMQAIQCWITSNQIDDHTMEELLQSVRSKKSPFFKGEEVRFYNNLETPQLKEEIPAKRFMPSSDSTEHHYSSSMTFQKCITLVGVTVVFERNPDSNQISQNAKGKIDLDMKINIFWSSAKNNVSRTAAVTYDLTERDSHTVSIFFPEMKCCAKKYYYFRFHWKGDGVQPVMQRFGPITHDLVKADQSIVWSFYQHPFSDDDNKSHCSSCRPNIEKSTKVAS